MIISKNHKIGRKSFIRFQSYIFLRPGKITGELQNKNISTAQEMKEALI